jgi:hypothetical protein
MRNWDGVHLSQEVCINITLPPYKGRSPVRMLPVILAVLCKLECGTRARGPDLAGTQGGDRVSW